MAKTLAEKVWAAHVVKHGENGAPDLLYIDLHLCHEVTSPQAFAGLRMAGRKVRRPDLTIATEDQLGDGNKYSLYRNDRKFIAPTDKTVYAIR